VTNLDGSTKFMVGTSNASAAVTGWLSLQPNTSWASTVQGLTSAANGTASFAKQKLL